MSATCNAALNTALAYLRAGLSFLPIKRDGSKAPDVKEWTSYMKRRPTEAEAQNWFGRPDPPGIGVVGGAVSGGLECIDFDVQAESHYPQWCELVEAEAPGLLARLCVVKTPRPGFHVRYRCTETPIPGSVKLAVDPTLPANDRTLIETRGEGGYAIAPGSPPECHSSGRRYEYDGDVSLAETPTLTAAEREILLRCARSFNREAAETAAPEKERGTGLRPGDDYNRRGPDWSEILTGWAVAKEFPDGKRYWRRPGKEKGWSATTGVCTSKAGVELFACFSENAAPFAGASGGKSCSAYSKFAAFTLLKHGGDFKAAAKDLADQGYGDHRHKTNGRANDDDAGMSGSDGEGVRQPRRIDASEDDLAALTTEAWLAIQAANTPPTLFRYGAVPSRIETDDEGAPMLRPMTVDRMRHRLARVAYWFRLAKKDREQPIAPPLAVVRDVLATPDPALPVLTRIVEAPIFAADGSLCNEPGYNAASRTFYAPAAGFTVPPVAIQPTADEIQQARELFTVELMGDFPFVGDAEKAHAVAAAVGPFVRDMIDGPTPLHSFEAPTPGTGKTLLVDLLTHPALGRPIAAMTEGRDEDEWRKRIFAKLRTAPSTLLLDNIKRRLESGALASAVTAYPLWEDRILGVSEIARVPVRCIWIVTGNNPLLSSEMTRRTVRIRLDARVDRPWLREGFRHADIRSWGIANRSRLVWAALTLVRAWIAEGQPQGCRTLGMFERWAKVLGGILDVGGIPGFLGNLSDFYDKSDAEGAAWREFVASWWTTHGENAVTASALWPLATECGLDLGDKGDQSQKIRLGKALRDMRDRMFAVQLSGQEKRLRIELDGADHRANLWRLAEG